MKKLFLAGIAMTMLVAASAMAAELPAIPRAYPAPPPPPPLLLPAYSWTGCYIGGNVGGVWVRKDFTASGLIGAPVGTSLGSHDANSFLGGIQGGCNYQAAGWVFGGGAGAFPTTAGASTAAKPTRDSRCVRRMRTRFSPRCTSSSAIPLSFTTVISSRISSIVMRSALELPQLLRCRSQDLASGSGDHDGVLNPHAAESLQIRPRFNRDGHTFLQARLV